MSNPHRGKTGNATYFITSGTYQKKSIFQSERMAQLLVEVLLHYRDQGKFLLHEFVIMPDHFHALLTPGDSVTLEKAIQLIKGGFSFRAKKQFGGNLEIWQTSFHDRRVRDAQEFREFRSYIHQNPVKRGLAQAAEDYPYGSASGSFQLDVIPQRLKPHHSSVRNAGLKPCATQNPRIPVNTAKLHDSS